MKTRYTALLITVFLMVSPAYAQNLSINVTQSIDEYSLNNPDEPVAINATINSSDPGTIRFQTNETGELANRSEYIDEIVNQDNQTYAEIVWNDQNDVSTRQPVQYRVQANQSFSSNKSFNISFQPVVSNLSISSNDDSFSPGDIITATADITHPVGRGRIDTVTAYWEKPGGQVIEYKMRRKNEISNQFTGYIYESSLGDTVELGAYVLRVQVSDNKVNASKEAAFSIEQTDEGVQLSPLRVGDASIFGAAGNLLSGAGDVFSNPFAEQNFSLAIGLFMLIISVLTTGVVKLGNRGVEENDFTR